MRALKSVSVDGVLNRKCVKDADVRLLRRAFQLDGTISEDEAELLCEINRLARVRAPDWSPFFVEAITDHVVRQLVPEGYVTKWKAEWLIARISRDGRIRSATEMDVLTSVASAARWVPVGLIAFGLSQVRDAVICGDGPMRGGEAPGRGSITPAEIQLVRTLLCAFAREGRVAITRTEAELLIDINDELTPGGTPPAWTELFVKALANVVFDAGGYTVPPRPVALAADGPLTPSIDAILGPVLGAYAPASAEELALARLERQRIEIVTSEDLGCPGYGWLVERLLAGEMLSAAEEGLVTYMRAEGLIGAPLLGAEAERGIRAA